MLHMTSIDWTTKHNQTVEIFYMEIASAPKVQSCLPLTFSVVEPVDAQDDLDLVRVLDEDGCVLGKLDEALEGDADG